MDFASPSSLPSSLISISSEDLSYLNLFLALTFMSFCRGGVGGLGGWWLLLEASLGGMGMLFLNPQCLESPHSCFLPWTALLYPFLERGSLL